MHLSKLNGLGCRKSYMIITSIVILTDLAILLNVPFLRQIFGFLFLTILPGVLILQILKLDKIDFTEKFVLSVGLSISFVMFFGLLLNNTLFSLGYETPLATFPLLISFNIAFIALAIIGLRTNKDPIFSLPRLNLTTPEKAFLIVPILFPALSIFGIHIMNTTDNNIILMLLLFLIPIYVTFVSLFNQKNPKRLYPIVIFLISISLLLLMSLRSDYIIGSDIFVEYTLFQTTLHNLHWSVSGQSVLDACLSISLLPAIYQSILNTIPEFLYKILYSLIYSFSPVAVYLLSRKYIGEQYAFLASCFFMFQYYFLLAAQSPRTTLALFFFALAMMTLFNDRIDPLKKRFLFIVFIASCIVSHYATAYVFFFIMLGAFVGMEILSKKYTFKKVVSLTLVILFFAFIFFWYSQVTETAFNVGVDFFEKTVINLNQFFIEESRSHTAPGLYEKGMFQKTIPYKIEFVFKLLSFAFIGIGVITAIIRYKEMSFPELKFKKPDFMREKLDVGYLLIALGCSALLVTMVVLPFVSHGYSIVRLHAVANTILSIFFVIGGLVLSKHFLSKEKQKKLTKNTSQVQAYLIILLVLIPYFLCVTDVTYNIAGIPRSVLLNSEGYEYLTYYVHDTDVISANWLKGHTIDGERIYSDFGAKSALILAYKRLPLHTSLFFQKNKRVGDGYIYFRYLAVIHKKVFVDKIILEDLSDYSHLLNNESMIYNNGYSEIYKPQGVMR